MHRDQFQFRFPFPSVDNHRLPILR